MLKVWQNNDTRRTLVVLNEGDRSFYFLAASCLGFPDKTFLVYSWCLSKRTNEITAALKLSVWR